MRLIIQPKKRPNQLRNNEPATPPRQCRIDEHFPIQSRSNYKRFKDNITRALRKALHYRLPSSDRTSSDSDEEERHDLSNDWGYEYTSYPLRQTILDDYFISLNNPSKPVGDEDRTLRLPDELILAIVNILHNTLKGIHGNSQEFLDTIRTCRRWYRIGSPMVLLKTKLASDTLGSPVKLTAALSFPLSLGRPAPFLSYLHRLEFDIPGIGGYPNTTRRPFDLQPIIEHLPAMAALRTVSITVDYSDVFYSGPDLMSCPTHSAILALFNAMPGTVRRLGLCIGLFEKHRNPIYETTAGTLYDVLGSKAASMTGLHVFLEGFRMCVEKRLVDRCVPRQDRVYCHTCGGRGTFS